MEWWIIALQMLCCVESYNPWHTDIIPRPERGLQAEHRALLERVGGVDGPLFVWVAARAMQTSSPTSLQFLFILAFSP